MMRRLLFALAFVAVGGIVTAIAEEAAKAPAEATAKQTNGCFVCKMCKTMATEAAKCPKCKMDMAKMHILKVKDGMAYCCSCGADCTCTLKEGTDLKQCTCGKDVVAVSLKGKYVCGCEPDCKCNVVSDKPGKCGCGKEMKEVK
jgi:hypothetical protein